MPTGSNEASTSGSYPCAADTTLQGLRITDDLQVWHLSPHGEVPQ
jgi:hypothetical protein